MPVKERLQATQLRVDDLRCGVPMVLPRKRRLQDALMQALSRAAGCQPVLRWFRSSWARIRRLGRAYRPLPGAQVRGSRRWIRCTPDWPKWVPSRGRFNFDAATVRPNTSLPSPHPSRAATGSCRPVSWSMSSSGRTLRGWLEYRRSGYPSTRSQRRSACMTRVTGSPATRRSMR